MGAAAYPMTVSTTASITPHAAARANARAAIKKHRLDAGQERMLRGYLALRNCPADYVTPEAEAEANITVVPLNLQTGEAADGGPRFVEPVPWEEMNEFVESNKPWEQYCLGPLSEEEKPENRKGTMWAESTEFSQGGHLLNYLEAYGHTQYVKGSIRWFNNAWKEGSGANPTLFKLEFSDPWTGRQWYVDTIRDPSDPTKPHAQVSMHGVVPLQDDKLTMGEMAVATGLIGIRRYFQKRNDHRYIPITILSASCRQLRILQVWHDKENPLAIHVRRSPIVDFSEGAEANRKDWVTFVCWLMGKPVGEALSGQAAGMVSRPLDAASSGESESSRSESHGSDGDHSDNNNDGSDSGGSLCDSPPKSEVARGGEC